MDREYFEAEIEPLLDADHVSFIGEIGPSEKNEFLGQARALLFPIDWSEPFGLVMIESMACGTPVIAYRSGSVPEVIAEGVSGFVVDDIEAATEAVGRLDELDRSAVRADFERPLQRRADGPRLPRRLRAPDRGLSTEPHRARPDGGRRSRRGRVGWRSTHCGEPWRPSPTIASRAPMTRAPSSRSTAAITSSPRARPADQDDQVLKHGESFAIFDRWGDIQPVGKGEEGLYHRGTRHLSGLRIRLGDERPLLLGSTTRHDNSRLTIDLTNPDMELDGRSLRAGTLHLSRTKVLWAGACHERIEVRNFGQEAVVLPISMRFAADFADIFEVRGMERPARGTILEPERGRRAESCWRTTASTACGARRRSASRRSRIGSSRARPATPSSSLPVARRRSSCGSTARPRRRRGASTSARRSRDSPRSSTVGSIGRHASAARASYSTTG